MGTLNNPTPDAVLRAAGRRIDTRPLKDVLISVTPLACEECQAVTYFSLFRPWTAQALCPGHLVPRLRAGTFAKLLTRLWSAAYHDRGSHLFEPQRAYWETLPDEQKWLQVGQHVDAAAQAYAHKIVMAMQASLWQYDGLITVEEGELIEEGRTLR